ncbi:ergothioneine biosynthesis protein EgtB [Oleiagrimonas sp.]|jgi:ergothioneine biosynthesis protein EgtB|uniref:ergothioneine biosynthesis protein EgtB n=1 Tax=Oleiagrimonas sp. TaxID=2010330 RepID=UPI00261B7E36|nr:ergothioneine biosynthesis protein EgtB [Oleiagrimonas sp.]MDA3913981.1 ergothioneine biosynthesis protein EgtB [Oleiagrimonas sp.]
MNAQSLLHDDKPRAETLKARYARVRDDTLFLCATLAPEDTVAQSMPDASPAKWHLAHTTWFFEKFVLGRDPDRTALHPEWHYLFNSYYQSAGPMHARPQRGLITRPTLEQIIDYRHQVDERVLAMLEHGVDDELTSVVILGLHHEQQHQELLLTDIKHLFSCNPLEPVYMELARASGARAQPLRFLDRPSGVVRTGHEGDGFAYDNECPRHDELLHPHRIAHRPVNNAEFIAFIRDGGYSTPTLWMSEGWQVVQDEGWQHPLYWSGDLASEFTLSGRREIDPYAPVSHVSFFEADAYARWAGARLPTEAEWETLAREQPVQGNLRGRGLLHPAPAPDDDGFGPVQLYGDVWEWTSSPYVNYPGFRPLAGALGEYNGKFMCGQWVLRGGSCVTPDDHIRASYRNFFYPASRWQFTGIRLGRDA